MLDRPESNPKRDALRRSAIAHTIYELIAAGLPGEPLRIGIYAEWGEGKSTVLNFIEFFCRQADVPVIWLNPWAAKDAPSLWRSFSREVRNKLRARRSWKERVAEWVVRGSRFSEWALRLVAKWKPWVAELLPLQKAIDAAARSLDQRRPALDRASVERYLRKLPATRRLVVIIDDLDRATPEVVPHLLLALREMFDVQGCAFIVALDPQILAKALPAVHPGWGTTGEFIEKIIQFPFWLPAPEVGDLLNLANIFVTELPISVDREVLRDLIDLVPRNPRRLKQYFRNIMRLRAVIERHDPDELSWRVLLLVELMRAIAPTAAAELFRDQAFLKLLSQSTAMPRREKDQYSEKVQKELNDALSNVCDRLGVSELRMRDELRRVVIAFGERSGFVADETLKYWAQLSENPPIFTWREFRSALQEWRISSTPETLRWVIEAHARSRELAVDAAMRDFFQTAVHHRQRLLDRAADVDLAGDLERLVQEANEGLRLIEQLALDLSGFSGEPPILGLQELHMLYEQIARWAHFTNLEVYKQTRAAERDLLLRVGSSVPTLAAGELENLEIWMPFRDAGGQPEARDLYRELVGVLTKFLFADIRRRFIRDNGIGSLWGQDRGLVYKYFLFRADSGFYTVETLEFLREAAGRAADSPAVQENFLEFLRLLTYGITDTLGVVTREEVMPLAQNREIVGLAWKAATTRELQPRTVGSLKRSREALARVAGTEEHLPVPQWWSAVSENGETAEGLGDPPKEGEG